MIAAIHSLTDLPFSNKTYHKVIEIFEKKWLWKDLPDSLQTVEFLPSAL
jgi:hypothetical protein